MYISRTQTSIIIQLCSNFEKARDMSVWFSPQESWNKHNITDGFFWDVNHIVQVKEQKRVTDEREESIKGDFMSKLWNAQVKLNIPGNKKLCRMSSELF